eukprot:gene12838-16974_t
MFLCVGSSLSASHLAFFPSYAPLWCCVFGWVMLLGMVGIIPAMWLLVLRPGRRARRFCAQPLRSDRAEAIRDEASA